MSSIGPRKSPRKYSSSVNFYLKITHTCGIFTNMLCVVIHGDLNKSIF